MPCTFVKKSEAMKHSLIVAFCSLCFLTVLARTVKAGFTYGHNIYSQTKKQLLWKITITIQ
jgi:hypothetical protein